MPLFHKINLAGKSIFKTYYNNAYANNTSNIAIGDVKIHVGLKRNFENFNNALLSLEKQCAKPKYKDLPMFIKFADIKSEKVKTVRPGVELTIYPCPIKGRKNAKLWKEFFQDLSQDLEESTETLAPTKTDKTFPKSKCIGYRYTPSGLGFGPRSGEVQVYNLDGKSHEKTMKYISTKDTESYNPYELEDIFSEKTLQIPSGIIKSGSKSKTFSGGEDKTPQISKEKLKLARQLSLIARGGNDTLGENFYKISVSHNINQYNKQNPLKKFSDQDIDDILLIMDNDLNIKDIEYMRLTLESITSKKIKSKY